MKDVKNKNQKKTSEIPVRINIKSERYEICGTLFDAVYGVPSGIFGGGAGKNDDAPVLMTPEEELLLGVMADTNSPDGYYVKPATPGAQFSGDGDGNDRDQEDDSQEKIQLFTEGMLSRTVDRVTGTETVTLAYDESELTGMEGAHSTVSFRTDEPGLIHMIRFGSVSTALTFRAHHRAICTYNTSYMPFQIGIHSLVVDNRLLSDNELLLDYIIEIRGARAERCRMTIKLHEA